VNLRRGPGRFAVATGAVWAALSGWGAPRVAAAADVGERMAPRRVVLELGGCPEVSAPALRRIVGIEIGDLLVSPNEPVSGDTDHLAIACTGAVAHVRAEGPGRPRQLERALPLDDFPGDAAPRALALAAIEMLAALSPDVRERIEARQRPRAPTPVPVTMAPTPPRGPSWLASASGVRRAFLLAHGASAWGARLGLEHGLGARWELGADGELVSGTTTSSLGTLTTTLASAGAFVGVHGGGPHVAGGLALGGRVGGAWLAGHPTDPGATTQGRASRPWGGPLVAARLRGTLGPLALQLGAELGFALGSAKGSVEDVTAVTVGGPWLALSAGLGLWF
jgi:hypothetical protein